MAKFEYKCFAYENVSANFSSIFFIKYPHMVSYKLLLLVRKPPGWIVHKFVVSWTKITSNQKFNSRIACCAILPDAMFRPYRRLFHWIRCWNIERNLIRQGSVLGFSANRVWLVSRFYISTIYYKAEMLSIPPINTIAVSCRGQIV